MERAPYAYPRSSTGCTKELTWAERFSHSRAICALRSAIGTRLEAEGGGVYQGDVKDGSSTMHGTGTYWYPGGDVYSGQWQDDECCGVGEYVCDSPELPV